MADIRVYLEDYKHDTWDNIAKTRGEVVRLMMKLKENELYKREMEVLKEKEEEVSIVDLNEQDESQNENKLD